MSSTDRSGRRRRPGRSRTGVAAGVALLLIAVAVPLSTPLPALAVAPRPMSGAGIVLNANPSMGTAPLLVDFSLSTPNGTVAPQYEWAFGDGEVPERKRTVVRRPLPHLPGPGDLRGGGHGHLAGGSGERLRDDRGRLLRPRDPPGGIAGQRHSPAHRHVQRDPRRRIGDVPVVPVDLRRRGSRERSRRPVHLRDGRHVRGGPHRDRQPGHRGDCRRQRDGPRGGRRQQLLLPERHPGRGPIRGDPRPRHLSSGYRGRGPDRRRRGVPLLGRVGTEPPPRGPRRTRLGLARRTGRDRRRPPAGGGRRPCRSPSPSDPRRCPLARFPPGAPSSASRTLRARREPTAGAPAPPHDGHAPEGRSRGACRPRVDPGRPRPNRGRRAECDQPGPPPSDRRRDRGLRNDPRGGRRPAAPGLPPHPPGGAPCPGAGRIGRHGRPRPALRVRPSPGKGPTPVSGAVSRNDLGGRCLPRARG